MHMALLVIAAGALITFFTALHGRIIVAPMPSTTVIDDDGKCSELPFAITLREAIIDYYPASTAPRGYRCDVRIERRDEAPVDTFISIEQMLTVDNYRFTLVSIGPDYATFTVNRDPAGILITYTGYILLILSMIGFFFQPSSGLRVLIRKLAAPVSMAVWAFLPISASASDAVPDHVARTFGKIYVYWDDRPAPMQTMSKAILTQVYGSDTYLGQTSDQVLLGWLMAYDQWKHQPIFKIKKRDVKEVLGIDGDYACLTDFFDAKGYKLQPLLEAGDAEAARVDRGVQLISSVATGALMRIFPYFSANGHIEWLSWTDYKPSLMSVEQWDIVSNSMGRVMEALYHHNPDKAKSALLDIRDYQLHTVAESGTELSQTRFRAEIIYNKVASPMVPSIILLAVALCLLVYALSGHASHISQRMSLSIAIITFFWLSALMALRWKIAGHWPLTNGPESMELMAWVSLLGAILSPRRHPELRPAAMLVAALALAVAAMSGNADVISPLLPVLNSPLLSVHVFVIMCSYTLLSIILILSLCVIAGGKRMAEDSKLRFSRLSLVLLYPSVFLLAAGIFIGAVWANQSWGRYWGWDPKETWALITMMLYAVPLHWRRLAWCRRPLPLSIYLALCYLSVLTTYFGVNFLFGGLHSYAG